MSHTQLVKEIAQPEIAFFAQWAQCHRSLIIQQTFRLYDVNYFYLHKLYKHGQLLTPLAMYRRNSFCVVSRLLERSRYTAQLGLRCHLNLSPQRREEMHLLSLRLRLYLDSQQLQLCPKDQRWQLDMQAACWQDNVNRRWLLGRYLYSILSLLAQRRVVLE